ncbi:protein KHNYN [Trichosurus vulpecula]|uniref:protein KHNYN n=1 Tax=Trichosurus vulpecula TaxID=9337 RepID=UPI00186AD9E3|nr:protein KHNYN [Trichosurus vulpecula]
MLPSGATPGTTDRFTVPADAEDVVLKQRPQVERIFRVLLSVLEKTCPGSPHIWLQLEGPQKNVGRAKEYLKGLCNPEVWEEVTYPAVLHCVFFGAGGLFLDCLCWGTSAHMVPQAPGSLLLGGLIEAFVMAQSRMEDLLGRLRQDGLQRPQSKSAREQVTQAFKALVGSYGDEQSRALLGLPVSVQEWLLNLVEEAGREQGLPEPPLGQERSPVLFGNGGWEDPVRKTLSEGREVREDDIVSLGTRSVDQEGIREGVYAREECLPSDRGERDWERLWSVGKEDSGRIGELVREQDQHTHNVSGQRNLERPGSPREGLPGQRNWGREGIPEERNCPSRERNWGKDGFLGEKDWNGDGLTMGRDWGRDGHFGQRDCGKGGHNREEDQDRVQYLEGKGLKREEVPGDVSRGEGPQSQDHFPSPHSVKADFLLGVNQAAAGSYGHCPQAVVCDRQWRGPLIPVLQLNNGESSPPMGPNLLPGAQSTWLLSPKPGNAHSVGLKGQEPPKGSLGGTTGGSSEVTKTQRFLEALKTPFSLNLTNVPGATDLRHVIIDGSNIAMIHGLQHFFSCRGIALAVQYFWDRGHRDITVFVPQWRLRKDAKVKERHFLTKLQSLRLLSVTPSRIVEGKRITSYDDRFMVKLAEETDGIIVSNDQFRDLSEESVKWAEIIRERLLPCTFVGNIFMVPDDPLGREGPTLDEFLKKPNGPQASRGRSTGRGGPPHSRPSRPSSRARSQVRSGTHPRPLPRPRSQPRPHTRGLTESDIQPKQPEQKEEDERISGLRRARETEQLRHKLLEVFWGQDHKVDFILQRNPSNRDLNQLSDALLSLNF